MKVSLRWLRDYVDFDLSPEALADKLAMVGLEVEAVEDPGLPYRDLFVGEVLMATPQEGRERLRLCRVKVGEEVHPVVCGATNVEAGQKVPVALPGSRLPRGQKVVTRVIGGQDSRGMLLSGEELALEDRAEGIFILPPDVRSGAPLSEALGLEDLVFEFSVTPNRPDCLSVVGIAREVAAIVGSPLKLPPLEVKEEGVPVADLTSVSIEDPEKCPRYAARVISGVRIGPSPLWLLSRLKSVGLRAINNVVDVTNYVMWELGHPLHAFDQELLEEGRIVVRCWRPSDGTFRTLDGVERELTPEDLVIADARRAVAIAGVMGGANSEVEPRTERVLLESAYFQPLSIRRTSNRQGLSTEASYRFERGADPMGLIKALDRAAELIRELSGGLVAAGRADAYPAPIAPRRLSLRPKRVRELLGASIPARAMREQLERLGLGVEGRGNELRVLIPTFRPDLEREVDLVEEVARRWGFERVPATLPSGRVPPSPPDRVRVLEKKAREVMCGFGFTEAINFSFIGQQAIERAGIPAGHPLSRALPLTNPLSAEMSLMRTSLIPGLLENALLNQNRRRGSLRLFELGRVFYPRPSQRVLRPDLSREERDQPPQEVRMLAALASAEPRPGPWPENRDPLDFFFMKGVVEQLLEALRISGGDFEPASEPFLEPSSAARLLIEGKPMGLLGRLSREAMDSSDLREPFFLLELDFERLISHSQGVPRARVLPRYPATLRDIAVIVDRKIAASRVEETIRRAEPELLREARLFDVYEGRGIPAGKRSLAFSLAYRADDRTLTDEEVRLAHARVVHRLEEELAARLR